MAGKPREIDYRCGELDILQAVKDNPGKGVSELIRDCGLNPGLAQTLNRLARLGLVEFDYKINPKPGIPSIKTTSLTALGEQVLTEGMAIRAKYQARRRG